MKIDRYKIEGLHNQFSFEGKMDANVNILVGNNGSFKSTLLHVLYYMLQGKNMHGVYNIKNAFVNFDRRNDTIVYRSFEGSFADLQEKAKSEESIADAVEKIKKKIAMDNIQNIVIGMEQYGYSLNGEASTEDEFKKLIKVDLISTFDIKAKAESDNHTLLDNMLDKLQSEYSFYLSDLAKQMTDIINKDGSISKENLDRINCRKDMMIRFVNESFSKTGKALVPGQGKLMFRFDNGHTIDSYALSAGEKQLLIILLTVLLEDSRECIVLLDEPEISLHIDWQYKLIEMMTQLNPNAQFILTTHSPGIFADGWGNKIVYMDKITHTM